MTEQFGAEDTTSQVDNVRETKNETPSEPHTTISREEERELRYDPKAFVLLSTGPASAYQGSTLGVYTLYPGSSTVYQQQGGDYYIYQDKDHWYVSPRVSGCNKDSHPLACAATWTASIKTSDTRYVGPAWSYGKDNAWANDDPTLQFVPITSPAAACIRCSALELVSAGPEQDYLGLFYAVPDHFSAGRPVYKNSAGLYLMVKNEYSSFSVWEDEERRVSAGKGEEGGRSMRSAAAPTCVTHVEGLGSGWQVKEGEGWVDSKFISAKCV